MAEYRIIQGGQVVAGASGADAWREIKHYAAQYADEGPLVVQEKYGARWKDRVRLNVNGGDAKMEE